MFRVVKSWKWEIGDMYQYVGPVHQNHRVCGIKPNNYSSRIPQILKMVELAKQSFPSLKDEDIHVVAYDGDRWKRQVGIEFLLPADTKIPDGWNELHRLEYAFAGN